LKNLLVVIILLCFWAEPALSQRYLVLERYGKGKRIRFYPGDEITLKFHNDKLVLTGTLNQVTDSTILLDDQRLFLHQIKAFKFKRKVPAFLLMAGLTALPVITVLDGGNQLFNEGNGFNITQQGRNLSYFFGGISFVSWPFVNYQRKIGRRWILKSFNHDLPNNK